MKFGKLYLKAFGPFTGKLMDFESAGRDFNVIYGPNEAGKSSMLRAIAATLFGIPQQTPDNFLHDYAVLGIAAVLIRKDGSRLAFMRRKGRQKTLLLWNESLSEEVSIQALAENELQAFLEPLDDAQFHSMFGLNHDRLVQGGKDILEGKGDLGPALFEAGTGMVGLGDIRTALERDAERLFKARARDGENSPLINKALSQYKEARRRIRELAVKSGDWVKLNKALECAKAEREEITRTLQGRHRDHERLLRIRRNRVPIGKRAAYLMELESLREVPLLPKDAPEQRITAMRGKREAESVLHTANTKSLELQQALQSLTIPQELLDHELQIEDQYLRLQAYRKAVRELPQIEARRRDFLKQAQTRLQEIQPELALQQAGSLRPGRGDVAKIRHLITEYSSLSTRVEALKNQQLEKQQALRETEREILEYPEMRDLSSLEAAIDAGSAQGDQELRLREVRCSFETLQKQLADEMASLGDRTAEELQRLPVPVKATLDRFEQEDVELKNEHRSHDERISTFITDRRALLIQMAQLEATGDVPDPSKLTAARERREQGWQLIRRGYIERSAEVATLAPAYDPNRPLPEAFERSVAEADRVADLLHANSTRVAQYQGLTRRVSEIEEGLADAQKKKEDLEERRRQYCQRWAQLLASLGLHDKTPRELAEWLQRRERVLERINTLQQRASECRRLEISISEIRESLDLALQASGFSGADRAEPLSMLLNRCRKQVRKITEENNQRANLKQQIFALEKELRTLASRAQQAENRLVEWRSHWALALEPIGLKADAFPAEVEVRLEVLKALFEALDGAASLADEIKALRGNELSYTAELSALTQLVAPDLSGKDTAEVAETLYRRYQKAKQDLQKRHQLEERLKEETARTDDAHRRIESSHSELTALCMQAQCSDVDQLPGIEEQSSRKQDLMDRLRELEDQLIEQNGAVLSDLLREVEAEDCDSLPERISGLAMEIEQQDCKRDAANREIIRLEGELQRIDGSAQAADALQQEQEALAQIRGAVYEYARLKLSSALLGQTIDTYRERNQGPILKRASEIFTVLTCMSFVGLDTQFDNDRLVVVGKRSNGERVTVQGMSDGTVDQLYLALRLAAIERYFDHHEPIPLIVDDILIQFDDLRATKTLKVLEGLSARTQILFFTHHEHILTLAKQHLGRALVIHALEPQLKGLAN